MLLAEDNRADVLLVRDALDRAALNVDLHVMSDGEEMFRAIERMDSGEVPCPDLVLLDLNLPRRNGAAILARMRASPLCRQVPVVIVSSSKAGADLDATARLGATEYFSKPFDYDEFMQLGEVVRRVLRARETGS